MKLLTVSLLIFALAIIPFSCTAQTPSAQSPQEERIVVGTNEVALDAVVRDKKGHILKDLKPTDFEVYEDGVPQQIKSFRLVTRELQAITQPNKNAGETPVSPVQPRPDAPFDSTNRLGAVALVFDRLSPDARAQAQKAALGYISEGLRADDFVGVFGIDLSLRVLQSFTNNAQLVRQAIERAVGHAPSSYNSTTDQIGDLTQSQIQLQDQASVMTANGGQNTDVGAVGANAVQQAFNQMTLNTLEGFERLEHDQQGYATTNGLLAIINAMRRLPGRKALIFFSEGVSIPPSVQAHFDSVISNANRANVSIYAVDAAGLRVLSSDMQAGRAMTALGQKRARQASSPLDATDGPMMRDLERNEDLLRLNPDSGLGVLANQTGGLLINDTNNLNAHLRQIVEDLHTYYLLTYTPKNQNYDGRFRRISVKVNRPGVEVQARKGYFAINASYSSPVLDYEAPALAIFNGKPQPNAFQTYTAVFNFPMPNKEELVSILIKIPAGAVSYATDKEKNAFSSNFSVVALIKDESQQMVRKLSNQYLLGGALDKLEAAKRGDILFRRDTSLEPGRYTVSSIVYDALTGKFSENNETITVPNDDQTKLRLSSLVLVERAERLAADQQTSNPFHFGEVLLYPNLGEPLHKSVNKNLALYLVAYPAQGSNAPPKLNLQIMQRGRALAQTNLNLPAPDETGRIQFANAIPLDKFQPGEYDLKITARDARSEVTRTEHFTVAP